MNSEEKICSTIISGLRAGWSVTEIIIKQFENNNLNNLPQDKKVNRKSKSKVPILIKTKFPATVMVLGLISNKADVMPSHFFAKGLKTNTEKHLKVLKMVVKPWIDAVVPGRKYDVQQDGAPAHNSKATPGSCLAYLWRPGPRKSGPPTAQIVTPWLTMYGAFVG